MPFKCCFPGCHSNKYDGSEYVSVFRFPSNPVVRQQWTKVIPRPGFMPTKYSCVCLKHFNQSDIVVHLQKSETPLARQRPKLHPHAVPKLHPDNPAFFIRQPYIPRKRSTYLLVDDYSTETDLDNYSLSDLSYQQMMQAQINTDLIGTFDELKTYVQENNVRSDLNWQRVCTDDTVCFFIVNTDDRPYLEVSIKIRNDFSVTGWKGNVRIKRSMLKQILGRDALCDQYSKLHNMLGILRCRDSCKDLTIMKVENAQSNGFDMVSDDYDDDSCSIPVSNITCETIVLD